eukprot:Em0003g347a
MALGFLTTYIVAVQNNHVTPYLPYISDTGRNPPESCIFTIICSVSSFFLCLIVYVRFKHIHHFYYENVTHIKCWNTCALIVGFLSAFGLLLAGCFQAGNVPVVHFMGAMTIFCGGVLYAWLQSVVSYQIYHVNLTHHGGSISVCFKFFLSILATVVVVTAVVTGAISRNVPHSQAGVLHTLSTWSEWLSACTLTLFFLTLHTDFRRIQVNVFVQLRVNEGIYTPQHRSTCDMSVLVVPHCQLGVSS